MTLSLCLNLFLLKIFMTLLLVTPPTTARLRFIGFGVNTRLILPLFLLIVVFLPAPATMIPGNFSMFYLFVVVVLCILPFMALLVFWITLFLSNFITFPFAAFL